MSTQDDAQSDDTQLENVTQNTLNDTELNAASEPSDIAVVNRRQFLLSLGKWSLAVIGGIAGNGLLSPDASAWTNHGNIWVNHGGSGVHWVNGQPGGGWNNRDHHWNNGRWNNRDPGWHNRGGGWVNRYPGWHNHGGGWINRGDGWLNRGGGWVNRDGNWVNGRDGSWANGRGGSWANSHDRHRNPHRGRGRWVNRY